MLAFAETSLAQTRELDWGQLLTLAVFILIPLLGTLGKKLREGFDKKKEASSQAAPPGRSQKPRPRVPGQRPGPPERVRPASRSKAPPRRPRAKPVVPGSAQPRRPARRAVAPVSARRVAQPRPARPDSAVAAREREARMAVAEQIHSMAQEQVSEPEVMLAKVVEDEHASDWTRSLNRDELRRAMVLSEILRPPIALRNPQE
jgi:hypothetical protein